MSIRIRKTLLLFSTVGPIADAIFPRAITILITKFLFEMKKKAVRATNSSPISETKYHKHQKVISLQKIHMRSTSNILDKKGVSP